jgi:hypothetical protein
MALENKAIAHGGWNWNEITGICSVLLPDPGNSTYIQIIK